MKLESAKLKSSSDAKMITEVGIPLPGNKLGDKEDFDVKMSLLGETRS